VAGDVPAPAGWPGPVHRAAPPRGQPWRLPAPFPYDLSTL